MTWPLWCDWCNRKIRVGIGTGPVTLCNDCYETLDALDAQLGRKTR